MKGSEFIGRYARASLADRDAAAVDLALRGDSMVQWPFVEVPIKDGDKVVAAFWAASDYFAIGTEDDFIRYPLTPLAAQTIADAKGWRLPTRKMVDLVWEAAPLKVKPERWGPPYDESMKTMERFDAHNRRVQIGLEKAGWKFGTLSAGMKKDVVLSNRTMLGHVTIYGWHKMDGAAIQPLNALSHNDRYADYSHGVRFIDQRMRVGGNRVGVDVVLTSADLCGLVSDEGVMRVIRQPGTGKDTGKMKLGSKGPEVKAWQAALNAAGFRDASGAALVADGAFGPRTEQATRAFQQSVGLPATGEVGPDESAKLLTMTKPSQPTLPSVEAPSGYPFMQAKHYTPVAGGRKKIDLIVIHDMEYPENPEGAEWCAKFFTNPLGRDKQGNVVPVKASAHYCVDNNSIVQCVKDGDVAWHAAGANHNGIGIEHAGYAKQSRAEWLDAYSTSELKLGAKLCAELCAKYGIPIQKVSAEQLKAGGARGICGHADVTKAFGGTHWDPGAGFPWDLYLEWVKEAALKA